MRLIGGRKGRRVSVRVRVHVHVFVRVRACVCDVGQPQANIAKDRKSIYI